MITVSKKKDTISARLNQMLSRASSAEAFLNKVTFEQYKDAQRLRWITEGESEDTAWPALSDTYKAYKRKRFADYDGSGNKMMIATGALYDATVEKPYKAVTKTSLFVSINPGKKNDETDENVLDYAKHANKERPIMRFSKDTIQTMRDSISEYIKKGKK